MKTTAKIFDYIAIVNESDGLANLPTDEQMVSIDQLRIAILLEC